MEPQGMEQGLAPTAAPQGGGLAQQGQEQGMQEAVEQVIAMLQQGKSPEELVQMGVPEELIQMAMQMLQQEQQQQPQAGLAGQGM